MQTVEPLNTIPLQQFLNAVKAAEAGRAPNVTLDMNTAKNIFELLNNQKNSNRLIIFATHNRFFANKADCLLEMTDGSIKTINA